ncbi:MAG: translation initiation factor IF-2 N-terminal domain-containing protein, partial [Ruminococcus sp.]|nr:translation initiation factor IF-2 N-terminal domain-containing protein [Ruminococcus sp.]
MIKYKVKDAANDFALPNKKITEILKKHCNVDKKTMTTLTESELDVLFDVLTKEHAVKDFNAYFAVRNAKLEQAQEPVKEEPKEDKKPAADKTAAKKDGKDGKENKPAPTAKPAQPKEQKGESPNHQRKRKVIDTRATNVDVERYNSKYDDLASDTSKSRSTDRDHTTKKQKFSNRTQKQRGRKQGKRETEAERLKRIAMERKQKPITVQIPDEITVNELALRLKATVAEVVKKAFLMGTMVTATDTIDFDTASLIAM